MTCSAKLTSLTLLNRDCGFATTRLRKGIQSRLKLRMSLVSSNVPRRERFEATAADSTEAMILKKAEHCKEAWHEFFDA
jgi:hypothetical protein